MNDERNNPEEVDGSDELDVSGIAPMTTAHTPISANKVAFLPWHKPRKQWIRENQWAKSIASLIDQLGLPSSLRPLRYLSLPGVDLLDVRALQPLIKDSGIVLEFLGINSPSYKPVDALQREHEEAERALSLMEVRAMEGISPASDVIPERFELLSNPNSITHNRIIKRQLSFDVINLDLCGSLAEDMPQMRRDSLYDALFHLLRHQAETRADPWVLFITTRTNPDMVHKDALIRLLQSVKAAVTEIPAFRDKLQEKELLPDAVLEGENLDEINSTDHNNLVCLGLSKWVLTSLIEAQPHCRSDMMDLYGYHVLLEEPTCDMMSFGFFCKRLPLEAVDTMGLAATAFNAGKLSREQAIANCSTKTADKTANIIDVDYLLYRNRGDYDVALEQSVALMKSARYAEAEYREWAEVEYEKIRKFFEKYAPPKTGADGALAS